MSVFTQTFPLSATTFRIKHNRLSEFKDLLGKKIYQLYNPYNLLDEKKLIRDSIPIVIINFNRYNSLKVLVNWLLKLKTKISIIIIDNNSSYPKLLQYYKSLGLANLQIIYFKKNFSLDKILPISVALGKFKRFVVTDPDLVPYNNTPPDMLDMMSSTLDDYPEINHVGASIEINDIPSWYPLKEEVKIWEQKYWENKYSNYAYLAPIDTTFSMYRNSSLVTRLFPALRLDRPYRLKHVDWYVNPNNLSDECRYYMQCCSCYSTWNTKLKSYFKGCLTKLNSQEDF